MRMNCYHCGKVVTEKQNVRVKYLYDRFSKYPFVLIHEECLEKDIPDCCVCGDISVTTFKGLKGRFPVCNDCRQTVMLLDDSMGESKAAVIKEAQRLMLEPA